MTDKIAEFEKLLKEGRYDFKFNQGGIVKGKIVHLEKDGALVDIGGKTEAFLPFKELIVRTRKSKIEEIVKVGDEHDFFILKNDIEDERIILSLKKVSQAQGWSALEEAKRSNETLTSTVVSVVKGGVIVELHGIRGFTPSSQLSYKVSQQQDNLLGTTIQVKILELDQKKNKLILSQKIALQDEKADLREKTLQNLEVGQNVSGEVVRVTDFGAFVDIGGIDGLLPISEFSWKRVSNPQEVLKVGQKIEIKVLKIDRDSNKISLSLKRMQNDPWNELIGKINENEIIKGRVSRITNFGAFIEVYPGVEGLLPKSEITNESDSPRVEDFLKFGQDLEVLVKRFAPNEHRLSLSIKNIKKELDANNT